MVPRRGSFSKMFSFWTSLSYDNRANKTVFICCWTRICFVAATNFTEWKWKNLILQSYTCHTEAQSTLDAARKVWTPPFTSTGPICLRCACASCVDEAWEPVQVSLNWGRIRVNELFYPCSPDTLAGTELLPPKGWLCDSKTAGLNQLLVQRKPSLSFWTGTVGCGGALVVSWPKHNQGGGALGNFRLWHSARKGIDRNSGTASLFSCEVRSFRVKGNLSEEKQATRFGPSLTCCGNCLTRNNNNVQPIHRGLQLFQKLQTHSNCICHKTFIILGLGANVLPTVDCFFFFWTTRSFPSI